MERVFNYKDITLADIESNDHLIFVCDADRKIIVVEGNVTNE